MRLIVIVTAAATLSGCMAASEGQQVRISPALEAPAPASRVSEAKRIAYNGAGGYTLPDGSTVVADPGGGFRLPNGSYVTPDATGGVVLPNGSRCVPDGARGYLCP